MQTTIADHLKNDNRAIAAEAVLRKCVHCGFCLATCPTYNLLGDELDSPRGRIYLIKQVVEGRVATIDTAKHLDRCLTCRSCETTCPSGVEYSHLLEQGRSLVEETQTRPLKYKLIKKAVVTVLPHPARIGPLVRLGQWLRPVLPKSLKCRIPERRSLSLSLKQSSTSTSRKMLVLDGCVQPSMAPQSNQAAARILAHLGVALINIKRAGCCGAIEYHLNEQESAKVQMRKNIDAWWPEVEDGAEAIISTASGCGLMLKEYKTALYDDPSYSEKAKRISALSKDIVEVLSAEDLSPFHNRAGQFGKVAFHPPCTLQHGQQLPNITEQLLRQLGFKLTPVADSHICCGSAGTYSLFQPTLSKQLRDDKSAAILAGEPELIATANIGCQLQLTTGLQRPVIHWVELVDQLINTTNSHS
ncbi:MAG: glycolate oxidase subunit GlcF [Granulosicoccaceae bacterium]